MAKAERTHSPTPEAAATAATNARAKGACTDANPRTRLGPHCLAPPHAVTLTLTRTQVLGWVPTPLLQAVLETVAWYLDPHNHSYSLKMQESTESSDSSSESEDGGAGFFPDSSGDEAPTSTYIMSLYSNHEPRCVTDASCGAVPAAFLLPLMRAFPNIYRPAAPASEQARRTRGVHHLGLLYIPDAAFQ
jgi:hypothetical protein